jgi:TatD DNase family protein
MFFDSHCHLDLPPLSSELPQVLQRAAAAGVGGFVCPGVTPAGWVGIAAVAAAHPAIRPAFGIHPQQVDSDSFAALTQLERYLPAAAAVGEIGLDYSDADNNRTVQQELFRCQLRLAVQHSLPVIIHCRRASADLLKILGEESAGRWRGVMHAFSGSVETARQCIALGLMIGVAGPVTWSGAVKPLQLVREIPLEHLLLETDSPDLAPEPHRGTVNEPAFLTLIAGRVAVLKGVSPDTVARVTTANAERIFNG